MNSEVQADIGRTERDDGLDVIRAFALFRVFLWHATGWVACTWIGALPVMFFVSGHLLGASAARRGTIALIYRRFRRILIPFWVYGVVAWLVMWAAWRLGASGGFSPSLQQIASWVLPLIDPQGTAWEAGWLSQPLWYLRALLWLLLALPLLRWAMRRLPVTTLIALALATVLAQLRWGNSQWAVQDFFLYGTFFAAGLGVASGALPAFGQRWAWLVVPGVVASFVASMYLGAESGVVNDAHALHLAVGTYTLGVSALLLPAARRLAARAHTVVKFFARRSLTMYLWHSAAIAVVLYLSSPLRASLGDNLLSRLLVVVLAASLTFLITITVGWVEDLAGDTRPQFGAPGRWVSPVAVFSSLVIVLIATSAALVQVDDKEAFALPVPSQGPLQAEYQLLPEITIAIDTGPSREPISTGPKVLPLADMAPPADLATAVALQDRLDEFSRDRGDVGVQALVIRPGEYLWYGSVGESATQRTELFPLDSNTKSFTAALLLKAVDEGKINLDDPVGRLELAPWFTQVDAVTLRQLLEHSSGIKSYNEIPAFKEDSWAFGRWEHALKEVEKIPPVFAPGEGFHYSGTNFILAGLLAQQIYGFPVETLLTQMLSEIGLDTIDIRTASPGIPATGTGGSYGTIDDLARWGIAMWRDQIVMSAEMYEISLAVDSTQLYGPGTMAYCPCFVDTSGATTRSALGYHSGTSTVRYYPLTDTLVVLHAAEYIWAEGWPEAIDQVMYDLVNK